jgi:hypothetical protein
MANENHSDITAKLDHFADGITPEAYVQMIDWFREEINSQRYLRQHALCGFECIAGYREGCTGRTCCTGRARCRGEYESTCNKIEIELLKDKVRGLIHRIELIDTNYQSHINFVR